ncbi:hypothetical protein [Enterococcus hirae]|nr:hypothetical protein [Enterococcus hirae]
MKIGLRKPSIKKSISARTTGKAKRTVKKAHAGTRTRNLISKILQ